jgi:hypothetical protein
MKRELIEEILAHRIGELAALERSEGSRKVRESWRERRDELEGLQLRFRMMASVAPSVPSGSREATEAAALAGGFDGRG